MCKKANEVIRKQVLLLFLKVWVKDPATKYPLERSFWKKWDHKKFFFRNFSEKHCVLTFYKIYNIRKTSTSLLKYNTQHKVDLASSHYHDDNLFFLKDCSCLEQIFSIFASRQTCTLVSINKSKAMQFSMIHITWRF